jgi:ribosome-associated protein
MPGQPGGEALVVERVGAMTEAEADLPEVPAPDPAGDDSLHWVRAAARAATTKTDEETIVLDVARVLSIVGWFVLTAGRNPRQVRTIAEEIEAQVAAAGGPKPQRTEGRDAYEWVLLDYGDFVVHVFNTETRRFYDLERLWRDVPRIDWQAEAPVP